MAVGFTEEKEEKKEEEEVGDIWQVRSKRRCEQEMDQSERSRDREERIRYNEGFLCNFCGALSSPCVNLNSSGERGIQLFIFFPCLI